MPQTFIKDPSAVLDYVFDWSAWLVAGETISSRTVTAAPGITVDSSPVTDANTKVAVWLSGGSAGQDYSIACRITTSAARTDERTIIIQCRER